MFSKSFTTLYLTILKGSDNEILLIETAAERADGLQKSGRLLVQER